MVLKHLVNQPPAAAWGPNAVPFVSKQYLAALGYHNMVDLSDNLTWLDLQRVRGCAFNSKCGWLGLGGTDYTEPDRKFVAELSQRGVGMAGAGGHRVD